MALSQVPVVRKPEFVPAAIRRHWFGGRVRTQMANGLNFVFPEGERFFIRSVRGYADAITEPELRERVAAFVGQEAQHQRAHLSAFATMEAQGFEIASWMAWYEDTAYRRIEVRIPKVLRLSTTAALEHFTATFGELVLRTPMLDDADPAMRAMLKWHSAEEIEHRDVAFDVLVLVDPRWGVRMAGFGIAGLSLAVFWVSAARHLLRQDPPTAADRADSAKVRAFWRQEGPGFAWKLLAYLRPGFHPRQAGGDALAEAWLRDHFPEPEPELPFMPASVLSVSGGRPSPSFAP